MQARHAALPPATPDLQIGAVRAEHSPHSLEFRTVGESGQALQSLEFRVGIGQSTAAGREESEQNDPEREGER